MDKRRYTDFFTIPERYDANMTREAINETPDKWLNFYPHAKYLDFLNTLIAEIGGGGKSLWLTGNYGTGKSNAALVTQKLFMDDEERVQKWFELFKNKMPDPFSILNGLLLRRNEGTLFVYDYNAASLGPDEDFLVRLERSVVATLVESKMIVPPKANFEEMMARLHREDRHFFATRDSMQDELEYLKPQITTIDHLAKQLRLAQEQTDTPNNLLGEVQRVLHKDNIYLDISVPNFRKWISEILLQNNLERIVYLFDEFHQFIDKNQGRLKTFEDVTESPNINKFYLVPVTHLGIAAYWGKDGETAKKANTRFHFRNLQMPNDTAFMLAGHAFKPNTDPVIAEEWNNEKKMLWDAVRGIYEIHFPEDISSAGYIRKQSFQDILPLHPMAAFLLKELSEAVLANQRSIFEYLKGSADGREFQEFIRAGGPAISGKQFLTPDYLWKYFIERDDLGHNKEIDSIRSEFFRVKGREFRNKDDDDEDLRVLKTVLLFCLLSRLKGEEAHERLRPTVKNVELSFQGDGAIVGVNSIIDNLRDKHCFSVVNGNIELFASSVIDTEAQKKKAEYKFHDLLSSKTETSLEAHTRSMRASYSAGRFDIRVSDATHTLMNNITIASREKYSSGQNKDIGAVRLWFVVAKNQSEQFQIPDKIKGILKQLHDYRIMMFSFPDLTFCDNNLALWDEYIEQFVQYELEKDIAAKNQRQKAYERIEQEWFYKLKKPDVMIRVHYTDINGNIVVNDANWMSVKRIVEDYVRRTLPYSVDCLTSQANVFSNSAINSWATAGIQFDASSGTYKQLVNNLKDQGVSLSDVWFAQNTEHPLAKIRALFDKKISNTIDRGTSLSVRKIYLELKRAPFGMKYNALSAFSLGFALRHLLDKGYQWDNLQRTGALDVESLAEIIESTVKNDGQGEIKGEKLICSISRQDKSFIENAPKMFGLTNLSAEARVEDVLIAIQTRIEKISGRVPLWVLPEYIQTVDEPLLETITGVLDNICLAGSTSSKNKNIEDRTNAIQKVGQLVIDHSEIVEAVAKYVNKPEYFVRAFELYVDRTAPVLATLAGEVGDISHDYCRTILDKVAETAGLLWKQVDISKEIEEVAEEYEVVKILKPIIGFADFVTYKSAVNVLHDAICTNNKLPKALITMSLPSLSNLLNAISSGQKKASDIKEGLTQNIQLVCDLFFDTSKVKSIELLKQRLGKTDIPDSGLLAIYNQLPSAFLHDEISFLDDIHARIESSAKESIVQDIKDEWYRIAGVYTIHDWANENHLPIRFALNNIPEANDIISAIEKPEIFSSDRLAALHDVLVGLAPINIDICQQEFLSEVLPPKFAVFDISLSSLLKYLQQEYGLQPNKWPQRPDIHNFIADQYKITIAPKITQKIKNMPGESLKNKILQLAKDSPELGLLFWE